MFKIYLIGLMPLIFAYRILYVNKIVNNGMVNDYEECGGTLSEKDEVSFEINILGKVYDLLKDDFSGLSPQSVFSKFLSKSIGESFVFNDYFTYNAYENDLSDSEETSDSVDTSKMAAGSYNLTFNLDA
jgi:hypothetical protein